MGPPIVITAGGAGVPERTKGKKNSIVEETTVPTRKQQNLVIDDPVRQEVALDQSPSNVHQPSAETTGQKKDFSSGETAGVTIDSLYHTSKQSNSQFETISSDSALSRNIWLFACFFGIMISFVAYGLLLEYATSGGRKLHELSFLFVTSGLYTLTAAAGRHVRDETPTSIPPARFAVLGLTSMGSTFCSVRSLRYVIYPIQVLAKSCKPVPVMLMGALMGKTYPMRKYLNVAMIVAGVALFMGGGSKSKNHSDNVGDSASQFIGLLLLFISLCFDGGTGAYEDKLMAVHHVGPFDLMYNIQLGKTILAGVGLVVLNQVHEFIQMCQDMGFLLIALGLSGALGQVFIFITIAKFGALTCSIIGLARKVTTLVASILFFGHSLSPLQFLGLVISVGSMIMNFWGKKNKKSHGEPQPPTSDANPNEEIQKLLENPSADDGDVELQKPNELKK
jgi:solute carrier family 35 (UDP-galactose transporter), member B1